MFNELIIVTDQIEVELRRDENRSSCYSGYAKLIGYEGPLLLGSAAEVEEDGIRFHLKAFPIPPKSNELQALQYVLEQVPRLEGKTGSDGKAFYSDSLTDWVYTRVLLARVELEVAA